MDTGKHNCTGQEAYLKLSALCASAEYCEADLRRKMRNWEITDGSLDAVISRLRSERFIDDIRYAHAFARDKFRYNRWGRMRIIQELRMRHIDSNIIDEALEEINVEDNFETLRQLLETKKKSVKGKSDYEIRCKLIRFAIGRGFQMDDIMEILGDFY